MLFYSKLPGLSSTESQWQFLVEAVCAQLFFIVFSACYMLHKHLIETFLSTCIDVTIWHVNGIHGVINYLIGLSC